MFSVTQRTVIWKKDSGSSELKRDSEELDSECKERCLRSGVNVNKIFLLKSCVNVSKIALF